MSNLVTITEAQRELLFSVCRLRIRRRLRDRMVAKLRRRIPDEPAEENHRTRRKTRRRGTRLLEAQRTRSLLDPTSPAFVPAAQRPPVRETVLPAGPGKDCVYDTMGFQAPSSQKHLDIYLQLPDSEVAEWRAKYWLSHPRERSRGIAYELHVRETKKRQAEEKRRRAREALYSGVKAATVTGSGAAALS